MEKKLQFSIGLFDKDTHLQEHSTISAYKLVQNYLISEFWYGTIYEWKGIYTHDDWSVVVEPTLIAEVITDKDYTNFVKQIKVALNQESILVQELQTNCKFM